MDNTISELRFSDNWIRFLWSDGGEEYNSDEFCDYICNNGIVHKTTAANTAKSNGLAECMNQMIVFHAVSMLIDSKLPKSFWGEAFHTATYLIAWSPATGLKRKTQYKVLTGRRVDPTFFWPFGCIEFALVDKYHHKKLDSRAHKGIMLGYEHGKAYKLLDVSTHKIFSSQYVDSDEKGDLHSGIEDSTDPTQVQWEDLLGDIPYNPKDPPLNKSLLHTQLTSQSSSVTVISTEDDIVSVGDSHLAPPPLFGEPEMESYDTISMVYVTPKLSIASPMPSTLIKSPAIISMPIPTSVPPSTPMVQRPTTSKPQKCQCNSIECYLGLIGDTPLAQRKAKHACKPTEQAPDRNNPHCHIYIQE